MCALVSPRSGPRVVVSGSCLVEPGVSSVIYVKLGGRGYVSGRDRPD
jgi:hypothetical protein